MSPRDGRPADREEARQAEAAELDAEILESIGRGWDDPLTDDEFDALARAVFAHQHRFLPVYREFCLLRGVSAPADVVSWRDIPPVPAGAFKVGRWATFPPGREAAAFRTSGTTGAAAGIHAFETLALYNAAIVPAARRYLVPDVERIRCVFLTPPPAAAPASSLVHMFAVFREAFGSPGSAFMPGGAPEAPVLFDAAAAGGGPVLVAGPAVAFLRVLEAAGGRRWTLPERSRVMVTGGFKGVRTSADPAALAGAIEDGLGVPRTMQVEEYGMTELSSQHYTPTLRRALGLEAAGPPGFRTPPWARVRIVDPGSGGDVAEGEEGALVHWDPANRGSALVVQTSDVGAWTGEGAFVLRGRAPGAEARGCSLAADLWLDGA
ncbi:MAG TPA: hypothetical protein VM778_04740 [Gemmatimonadota bacterium]|nr:hypothetical protein [Gemmatimonadota bacterium]